MPERPVTAVVLAAGASRRMGAANKLLLDWGDVPVVRRTVASVCASRTAEVVVVVGHEGEAVRTALAGLDVRFASNPRHGAGMTTSIQAGLRAASPAAAGYMICLSDQPLIEPAEYDRLLAAFARAVEADPHCIVAPTHAGRRGHPVLFAAAHRAGLLALGASEGARPLLTRHAAHLVSVPMETDHVLLDVDTPEEYERLTPLRPPRPLQQEKGQGNDAEDAEASRHEL